MIYKNKVKRTCSSVFLVICLVLFSNEAYPGLYFVRSDASGNSTGVSWDDAFNNLQDALSMSIEGDTIFVARGIYYPDKGTGITEMDRNASFNVKPGVVILGGYHGSEDFLNLSTRWNKYGRDWQFNKTILSGDLLNNDNDNIAHDEATRADNSVHVITITESSDTAFVEINGFYIENGNANSTGDISESSGGALLFSGNIIKIKNCIFSRNSALESGGAVYGTGKVELKYSVFDNNAARVGGAVALNGSGNIAEPIHPEIINSFFNNNKASDNGGAVYSADAVNVLLTNNVFSGNSTINDGSTGAGIYADSKSYPEVTNCTFYNNSAVTSGGGISIYAGIVKNSILRNNIASSDAQIFIAGEPESPAAAREFSNSSVEGGYTGTNIFDIDPMFVQPDNPAGADNLFGTPDDGLRLSSFSPLIDSGKAPVIDSTSITFNLQHSDIVGLPRLASNEIDLGAYELQRAEINLEQLWGELKTGGYVVLFNHMMTNHTQIDSPDYDLNEVNLHNCAMQRNLTPEGYEQGKFIGDAFRALGITFDVVLCSPLCRTKESSREIFGFDSTGHDIFRSSVVWKWDEPGFAADRKFRVGTIIGPGHNTNIVTHQNLIAEVTGYNEAEIQEGDAIIFRPKGASTYDVVANLTTDTWEKMFKLTAITTSVEDNADIPSGYVLKNNYPNPFNPVTNIEYTIPAAQQVKIDVYNTLGEKIAVLVNEFKSAGTYRVQFNAANLASGIYFYSLNAGSFHQTRKLVLLK